MRTLRPAGFVLTALLVTAFLQTPLVAAQPAPSSPLTIESIMQDPDVSVGSLPSNLRWHENGQVLYFDWNPGGGFPSDSLYRVDRSGGEPVKVSPTERRAATPLYDDAPRPLRVYSSDTQRTVFVEDGDLYLYDRSEGRTTRLTKTRAAESDPQFDDTDSFVLFEREGNLFSLQLETGFTAQLTDLRDGNAPAEPDTTEQDAFLYEQQTTLFESIREAKAKDEQAEANRERDREADDPPPTFYTGDRELGQLQVDPYERYVTFTLTTSSPDAEQTVVVDYVTASGFADNLPSRPKVGIQPEDTDFYVQDLERDTTFAVDLHQLPGAYDVPKYLQDQGVEMDSSEAKRALYTAGPYWSPNGEHAVLEVIADDNKDRWITRLDAATGDLMVLDRQHDDAWIGGPGVGWFSPGTFGWVDDTTLYFKSERTGYSHLYTMDVTTGTITAETEGEFVVQNVRLTRDGSAWIYRTNAVSPHQWHTYRHPVDGEPQRLTRAPGDYAAAVSPDGQRLGLLYEFTNAPTEVYLQDVRAQAEKTRVTTSTTETWQSYDWRDPDIIRYEASDGMMVPAQIFRPETPNGAAVLFVHGAGYTQNVIKGWPYYFREYMFHNMLTDLGYTVLNVDYRGSEGYGRDWRTAIYRHMGGRDLGDYVDVSAYLAETEDIDPERQFIYGGSYGGFMTLMALFTAPDSFGGGAALRSVTDWAHYNDPYTSAILNTPATDSLAFARSSPIYFADGLDDPLLMPHGLIDTNVQPQDIFRLTQKLIELGKEDWELAIYPDEPHGFENPASWTDEYRRIFKLIEESVGPNRDRASVEMEADDAEDGRGGGP